MSESRDEREFTADLELRTPTWLPGGKFAIRFNRLWDKRASNFIKQTAQAANVDEETLLRRADEGDGFFDILRAAGNRAMEDGDPATHDLFARLVASALHGDARVQEVSYMLKKLEALQPLHIKIITAMPVYNIEDSSLWSLDARHGIEISSSEIAERIDVSSVLITSVMHELVTSGFVDDSRTGGYRLDWLGCALTKLIDSTS